MYQNKIFCAFFSLALIIYCSYFRQGLPAIYLAECLILFKTSIEVSFKKNKTHYQELVLNKDQLTHREKLYLVDQAYSICRYFKVHMTLILLINIFTLLYLGINSYYPSLLEQYHQYTYFFDEIFDLKSLSLMHNIIFNFLFFLVSFPYITSSFRQKSNINWQYFRVIYLISKIYRYLQMTQAILLIVLCMIKSSIAGYFYNAFAFLLFYQLAIQTQNYFQNINQSCKLKLLGYIQILIQYFLIILFSLEYLGLPQYGLDSFKYIFIKSKVQSVDIFYISLLGLSYILSLVVDLLYKVKYIRTDIIQSSDLSQNFDQQLMNQKQVKERKSSIIALEIPEQLLDESVQDQNTKQIHLIEQQLSDSQYTFLRIIIAIQQLYTIFILMRYPSSFYLFSIIWLFISSITRNIYQVVKYIILLYIPGIIYIIYNYYTLKVSDFILLWSYIILSQFIIHKLLFYLPFEDKYRQIQQIKDEIQWFNRPIYILWGFLLRNSYTVTLIIVFWISLFTANIIHTILLLTTILFIVKHENQQNMKQSISFRRKHWIWMVCIVQIIILFKYFYMLQILHFNHLGNNIIELFGLQFNYHMPFNLGFREQDFGSLSILWILNIFVVVQYETYKSQTYKQLSQNYQNMIEQFQFMNYLRLLYNICYYKWILWICYWFCLILLVVQRFNLINLLQILILLYTIKLHINNIIKHETEYITIQKGWNIFLNLVGLMILFRYLFDFSCLQLLHNLLIKFNFYNYISKHQTIIGLNKRIPIIMLPNLLLDIIILCLGYLGQDYLSVMNQISKTQNQVKIEVEMMDLSQNLRDSLLSQKENDQRDSIIKHFSYSLTENFPELKYYIYILTQLLPVLIYITAIVISITYKIAGSMLIYLLIMFRYIYQNRQYFREQFRVHKISHKLSEKIVKWRFNFITNVEKYGFHTYINDKEDTYLLNQIQLITKDIRFKSSQFKLQCNRQIINFSLFFIILTYLSQILKFTNNTFNLKTQLNLKYALFAFGTYTDFERGDFIYKDIYPYIIAIILIILDIKSQEFVDNYLQEQKEQEKMEKIKNRPFIIKHQSSESKYLVDNFYYNKYQLLKINCEQALIHASERMYMMILFFLAATSEGIFCIIYVLLFALVFYSNKNQKTMINLVSILVVIFQYVCYLVTLSQESSPREIPQELTQSEYIIFDFYNTKLIEQLGLSGKGKSKGIFIFNSLIIFAIWLFYYLQEILSIKIIVFIDLCYKNYKSNKIVKHLSSRFYILIKRSYILFIVYFPLFVQLAVLLYYSIMHYEQKVLKIINFSMFFITILYLFYQEIYKSRPNKQTQSRIDFYKSFIVIQQCAILSIFTILFTQKIIDQGQQATNLSIMEILVFYLLQLGKDMLDSKEYYEITDEFYFSLQTRSEMVGLAMSYQANNNKLSKLIQRFRKRNELKESVDSITNMISQLNQYEEQKPINLEINFHRDQNPMAEPLSETIYKWIENHRNRFLFEPSYQIFHFITCQNLEVLQIMEHQIEKVQFQEYYSVVLYLENLYIEATKYVSPKFNKEKFINSYQRQNQHLYNQNQEIRQIKQEWLQLKQKISEQSRFNNIQLNDIKYNKLELNRYILIIMQFILTFWHYICFSLFLIFYFINHGLITITFPFMVFAYGSIEEQQPDKIVWQISFIYLNFLSILDLLREIIPQLQLSWIAFLFGDTKLLFQFFIILAIIIQVNIMKNIGIYEKQINQYENIYGGLIRHLFNGPLEQLNNLKRSNTQLIRSRSQEQLQRISTAFQAQRVSIQMNETCLELQKLETDLFDYLTRVRSIKASFYFRIFSNMKPGKDIYPMIAGCQIILSIFIFLFYDQMKSMDSPSISEILKYSQFSGEMVIALLFQILCILVDRYIIQYRPKRKGEDMVDIFFNGGVQRKQNITLSQSVPSIQKKVIQRFSSEHQEDQKEKEFMVEQVAIRYKYYFQLGLLLIINVYMMYQIRLNECNYDGECKYITNNIFMIIFYILFCIYFFLSALQIKYGINDLRVQNTLMQGYKFHNFAIFKVYKLMPFLFEIRTLCDWAFAQTSLTLFQWIKLEEIHSLLYLAKCNAYYFQNKKVGSVIPFHNKCSLGFCFILALLALIFGPILLYSPLNPTLQNDNLIGANIEVGLRINYTNYYTFYINSHVSDIHQITDAEWNKKNLSQYKVLNSIERDSLQVVKLTHFSDTYWDISYPSLQTLVDALQLLVNKQLDIPVNLIQTYRFIRQYTDQTQQYISEPYILKNQHIQQIYDSILTCQAQQLPLSINLNNFYHDFIRIDKNKQINILDEDKKTSIQLQLNCTQNNQYWWSIYSDEAKQIGMKFYIVSDKYSSALLGYSVLGFYITIVYVAGKLARGIMSGGVDLIFIQDMPYPDKLIKICEAITLARIEKDLVQEELLYFQLIDIIRSPQIMKNISGGFYQQRKQRIQYDQENQQLQ